MQTHGWVYNAVHSHVSDMVSKILRHFSLEMRPGLPLTPSRYRAIAVRETSIREFNWIRLRKDTFLNPRLTFSYNNGVLSQLEEPTEGGLTTVHNYIVPDFLSNPFAAPHRLEISFEATNVVKIVNAPDLDLLVVLCHFPPQCASS